MAEGLEQTTQEVWDSAYWARVDAESGDVNGKIAEELGKVQARAIPAGYPSNSYNFRPGDVCGGEVDKVGRLRSTAGPSTREASLGIEDMPAAADILSVRALGTTSLAPEFSDPDGLPNYYD